MPECSAPHEPAESDALHVATYVEVNPMHAALSMPIRAAARKGAAPPFRREIESARAATRPLRRQVNGRGERI